KKLELGRDDYLRTAAEHLLQLFQGHSVAPALAGAVDNEQVQVLVIVLLEYRAQPQPVARRTQRLIGDDDAQIGKFQRLPIRLARDSRDIENDAVKLRSHYRDDLLDRIRRELHLVPQR